MRESVRYQEDLMKVQNILEEHILNLKFGDNLSLINTSAGDGAESADKRAKKKKQETC